MESDPPKSAEDFYEKVARDALKSRGEPVTPAALAAQIERLTPIGPPLDAEFLAQLANGPNGSAMLGMLRDSRRRAALLEPVPGAPEPSPVDDRRYRVALNVPSAS